MSPLPAKSNNTAFGKNCANTFFDAIDIFPNVFETDFVLECPFSLFDSFHKIAFILTILINQNSLSGE